MWNLLCISLFVITWTDEDLVTNPELIDKDDSSVESVYSDHKGKEHLSDETMDDDPVVLVDSSELSGAPTSCDKVDGMKGKKHSMVKIQEQRRLKVGRILCRRNLEVPQERCVVA